MQTIVIIYPRRYKLLMLTNHFFYMDTAFLYHSWCIDHHHTVFIASDIDDSTIDFTAAIDDIRDFICIIQFIQHIHAIF